MKRTIVTYNVNGIRAAIAKGFLRWLEDLAPDIVCIQETKAQPEQIPLMDFEALGDHAFLFSAKKKGYSGTAILSRTEPDHVEFGMGIPAYDDEGRFIRADFADVSVVSVYHPSGSSGDERQAFKMRWLEDYTRYIGALRKKRPALILSGDYNICHKPIDIHDPVRNVTSSGFLPEEREWMDRFLATGFIDTFRVFNQEPNQYTWWSYRANARAKNLGWRIDYHMVTENLSGHLQHAEILPGVMHSDHCPCLLQVDF